jgi:hypothetical protein
MAAVITSPSEHRRFVENPLKFAASFPLDPSEVGALIDMGTDLTSMTNGFVLKRATTLRWNARRTITMMGSEGTALLQEFVDRHAMTESLRAEAGRFGEFVIERTQGMRDGTPRTEIIAEMARFEKHRSDAFWEAVTEVRARRAPALKGRQPPGWRRKRLSLRPGANVGEFQWDLRILYRRRVAPLSIMQADPCCLLFFHNGTPDGLRVTRLHPGEACMMQLLLQGKDVVPRRSDDARPGRVEVEKRLGRFFWQGVIQWV